VALVERAGGIALHHTERDRLPAIPRALDQVAQQSRPDASTLVLRVDEELLEEEIRFPLLDLHPADVLSVEHDDAHLAGNEASVEAGRLPRLVPGEAGALRHLAHVVEVEPARERQIAVAGSTESDRHGCPHGRGVQMPLLIAPCC